MANANPWKTLGAIEFAETASQRRAASYRERAAHLSVMADEEPNGSLRTKLLELATQYKELGGEFQQLGAERAIRLFIGHHRKMRSALAVRRRASLGSGLSELDSP